MDAQKAERVAALISKEVDRRIASQIAAAPRDAALTEEFPRLKYLDSEGKPRSNISLRDLQQLVKDVHHENWGAPLPPLALHTKSVMRHVPVAGNAQRLLGTPKADALAARVFESVRSYVARHLVPLEERVRCLEGKD